MRLGSYSCELKSGSLAEEAYRASHVDERHRHRYEFNNEYLKDFEENGMIATGRNPESNLVEIMEIKNHPWFVGVQFHPELKSTFENPHPLFTAFVNACLVYKAQDKIPHSEESVRV